MKNQTGSESSKQSNGQKPPADQETGKQPSGDKRSGGQANDPADLDQDEAAEFDGLVKKGH